MFFGKMGGNMGHIKFFSPQIDLFNEILSASNGYRMPKLRPREVETPIYPNGTHSFGTLTPSVTLKIVILTFCYVYELIITHTSSFASLTHQFLMSSLINKRKSLKSL